jgi:hypothetical protein
MRWACIPEMVGWHVGLDKVEPGLVSEILVHVRIADVVILLRLEAGLHVVQLVLEGHKVHDDVMVCPDSALVADWAV